MNITIENNSADWARSSPADATNALREAGKKIDKSQQAELQRLEDQYGKFAADHDRLCSPAAIAKLRQAEHDVVNDNSLPAEEVVKKLHDVQLKIERAPEIANQIVRQQSEILKKMSPAVVQILKDLMAKIDAQLSDLPKFGLPQWGIAPSAEFEQLLANPLHRLRSMAQYDVGNAHARADFSEINFSSRWVLHSAGVIEPKAAI